MNLHDDTERVDDDVDDEAGEWLSGLRAVGLPVRTDRSVRQRPAGLARATVDLVDAALAPATRRAYEESWARYCTWCDVAGLDDPYTATVVDVANWVTSQFDQHLSTSYIRRQHAAVTWAFDTSGLMAPTRHPIVRQVVAGAARNAGRPVVRSTPLALAELRHVVNGMAIVTGRSHSDPAVRRDRALLLVGWWAALRSADMVGLDVEDLQFRGDPERGEGGMLIRLRQPKRRGGAAEEWVAVPYTASYGTCPVRAVMLLARQHRTGPIFRRLDRRASRTGSRLGAEAVTAIVRQRLEAAGIPADTYTSHSLRAGWVTEARQRGLPAQDIMRHTRHVDARMLHVYDRPADLLTTPVTTAMGEW